jgi:hypothetical protein
MSQNAVRGPTTDTQAGDIVIIVVLPDTKYGVNFTSDSDGCAAIVESFDRIENGKFGPIQKHGGVHYGDVLFEFNDIPLLNTKHADVLKMISDKKVLKRELKFINSKDYYRRK